MKVLFPALRVTSLEATLAFYTSVGFEVVGRVEPKADTQLVMLALPQQADVSLELVHSEADVPVTPGGLDHLAIQVDDVNATRGELKAGGLDVGPVETPGGPDGPHTASLFDPDGYHLELVQWPPSHPVAMTRADFESAPTADTDASKDTRS